MSRPRFSGLPNPHISPPNYLAKKKKLTKSCTSHPESALHSPLVGKAINGPQGLKIDLAGILRSKAGGFNSLLPSPTLGTRVHPVRPHAGDSSPPARAAHTHQLHPQRHDLVPQAVARARRPREQHSARGSRLPLASQPAEQPFRGLPAHLALQVSQVRRLGLRSPLHAGLSLNGVGQPDAGIPLPGGGPPFSAASAGRNRWVPARTLSRREEGTVTLRKAAQSLVCVCVSVDLRVLRIHLWLRNG